MGNTQSNEEAKSPHGRDAPRERERHGSQHRKGHSSRDAGANPAPPSNLVPLASSSSTSTSTAQAHAHVARSPSSSKSSARARAIPDSAARKAQSAMGSSESRPVDTKHRSSPRSTALSPIATSSEKPSPSPKSSTQPVNVPPSSHDGLNEKEVFSPSGPPTSGSYPIAQSTYTRPPRLPLPIEEEVYTPGSPIITPQDLSSPLEVDEVEGTLPRRTSVLSSTTVDDEDIGDNDAFALESSSTAAVVPTTIEWRGRGEKVYVTGTFVNWERKFKLHRDKETGIFSATLQLKPGTHHIKFLADNDMVTSDNLPTTVDYTNILVNYIEVVAPMPQESVQTPAPAEPMPIPGTAATAGQTRQAGDSATRPLDIRTAGRGTQEAPGLSSTLQETIAMDSRTATAEERAQQSSTASTDPQPEQPQGLPAKPPKPRPKYTNQLPDYLYDLDHYTDPEDERHQRSNRVLTHLPPPPSLPMFMSKSILNGTTPHKDDASVLIMPNHTVLNHLATSSIKSGVLATSGTTRYKRKFLTTIMYKPTSEEG